MIAKLRRRMTLLVAAVLILVTIGIICSINYMNWRNLQAQTKDALDTLVSSSGVRPSLKRKDEDVPPPKPEEDGQTLRDTEIWDDDGQDPEDLANWDDDGQDPEDPVNWDDDEQEIADISQSDRETNRNRSQGMKDLIQGKSSPGQPPDTEHELASLSNYYVVSISKDGSISNWTSDRADLYTDEQVMDITQMVLDSGGFEGRIGTQFYRLTSENGKRMLIVLDARLEIMNIRSVLRMTTIIASLACLILCALAYLLIRVMIRPVQEAFERQRQFVWDASHELKTPLAVIGANAQVLEGEMGENEYLGYITGEVKRADRLVGNLLRLARMDRGTTVAKLVWMDLGNTVLSAELPLESSAFEEGKTLSANIEDGVMCKGDPDMIAQLCVILIDNAIKYSAPGGEIVVCVVKKGKGGQIQVSDIGNGISTYDQEHIFDRFYRADSSHSKETEGNGLGLAIARSIVDAHKGKMKVSSIPVQEEKDLYKTTFTVTIP